jgi:hypothetical protein
MIVERNRFDLPLEMVDVMSGKELWRELTFAEILERETASDKAAVRFLDEAEGPVLAARRFLDGVDRENDRLAAEIAELERRQAELKEQLVGGVKLRDSAAKGLADQEAKRSAWIEASGYTEEALLSGVRTLQRQPEPEPDSGPTIAVPAHTVVRAPGARVIRVEPR